MKYLYILIGSFLSAIAPLLNKIALNFSSVTLVTFLRYIVTNIIILIFFRKQLKFSDLFIEIKKNKKLKYTLIILIVISLYGSYLFNYILNKESAVIIVFLTSVLNIFFSTLLNFIFNKRKVSKLMLVYILLCCSGLYFILTNGEMVLTISFISFLLVIFLCLTNSTEYLLNEVYLKETGDVNLLLFIKTFVISFSLLPFIMYNIKENIEYMIYGGIILILIILYLGLSTYIRNVFNLKSIEAIGPDLTVIFSNSSIIFVAIIGFVFLNEPFTIPKLIGILIVSISLILISIENRKKKK